MTVQVGEHRGNSAARALWEWTCLSRLRRAASGQSLRCRLRGVLPKHASLDSAAPSVEQT